MSENTSRIATETATTRCRTGLVVLHSPRKNPEAVDDTLAMHQEYMSCLSVQVIASGWRSG